ncbi:MAG: cytochrome c3 family protein [Phycisphaeraceae bacterium]
MKRLFTPYTNTIARATALGVPLLVLIAGGFGRMWLDSSYETGVGEAIDQPVPFSHEHHVAGLGIDCRFCHLSAETSSVAGVPATEVCMTCHSQIWTNAQMLQPVRDSFEKGQPIQWVRVNDLPDFVYFDHSIHVAKGVGCAECHGEVHRMPMTWKAQNLHMTWCLDCHRDPEKQLRPKDVVFSTDWFSGARAKLGAEIARENKVNTKGLTNCSTCHR